jgi:hypothetical protein
MKRKTRQGKALEKRVARSFMDVLQEVINLVLSVSFLHIYFLRKVLKRFSLWNCDRQIWNPYLLMSQHIWGLLWVHRALHLDGTTAQYVVVLQTTHAWGVEHGSVLAAVKSYTMIHAAWNLWLDQLDIQATFDVCPLPNDFASVVWSVGYAYACCVCFVLCMMG